MTQKVILQGEIDSIDSIMTSNRKNKKKRIIVILKEKSGNKLNLIPIYFNFNALPLVKSIEVGDILKVRCEINNLNNHIQLNVVSAKILQTSKNSANKTIRDVRVKVLNGIYGKYT